MKKLVIAIILILTLTVGLFMFAACAPIKSPNGDPINLDGMKLVFSDDFDNGKLDETSWTTDKYWDGDHEYIRRGGYWDKDQLVFSENGTLNLRTEYKDNGKYGSGWYTGMLNTRGLKSFKYGYFEVRCKAPAAAGLWSAFWMLSDSYNTISNDGHGGAEIDIMESPYYNDPDMPHKLYRNTTFHTIHIDGYNDEHKSVTSPKYNVQTDMYKNFNTYGLLWRENEYVFYINGVETWRTSFGVSDAEQYLILSIEIAGAQSKEKADPSNPNNKYCWSGQITDNDISIMPVDFAVDYVRVYQ